MRYWRLLGLVMLVITTLHASPASHAAAVGSEVGVTGNFSLLGSDDLASATGLSFSNGEVGATEGDFDGLGTGTTLTLADLVFSPGLTPQPLTWWSESGYGFQFEAITFVSQSSTSITIAANGVLSAPGADDSAATLLLLGSYSGGVGAFSSTAAVVPIPAALPMLGSALVGLLVAGRRRDPGA